MFLHSMCVSQFDPLTDNGVESTVAMTSITSFKKSVLKLSNYR